MTFPALDTLIHAYLHQDMDLEAETIPEAIALFASLEGPEERQALIDDLSAFLATHGPRADTAFDARYQNDLSLREMDTTAEAFFAMIRAIVDDPARFTDYLEPDQIDRFDALRDFVLTWLTRLLDVSDAAVRAGLPRLPDADAVIDVFARQTDAERQAGLLADLDRFVSLYGDRADAVFDRRFGRLGRLEIGTVQTLRERLAIAIRRYGEPGVTVIEDGTRL